MKGGQNRMRYCLPTLIFQLFKLSAQIERTGVQQNQAQIQNDEEAIQIVKVDQLKIFKLTHELIQLLQEQKAELCMRLYLQACQAINKIQNFAQLEELAYEFVSQAMLIY